MGVVVTAREPLRQDCIARLVGLTVAEVGGIILRIQSILDLSNGKIKVLHKSLNDFLSSHDRCKTTKFCIETTSFHSIIANSSLQIMTAYLCRNMANLADFTAQFSTTATLNVIDSCVRYCCKFWMSHLLASRDYVLIGSLNVFCSKSLRYWIEALVLVGDLTEDIPNQITRVAAWISKCNETPTNIEINTISRDLLLDTVMRLWSFEKNILYNPLNIYSIVTVNHVDSGRTIWLIGVNSWTFDEFKIKVAKEFNLHPQWFTVLSKKDSDISKIVDEQSFQMALQATSFFLVWSLSSTSTVGGDKNESLPSDEAQKPKFDVMLSYSMELDSTSFTVCYTVANIRIEVIDDELLRIALKRTQRFDIEPMTSIASSALAPDDYTTVKMLGHGSYARVVEAVSKSTAERFAMKVIGRRNLFQGRKDILLNEIETLKRVSSRHQNILNHQTIPENLLFRENSRSELMITDFGLSRIIDSAGLATSVDSQAYMAQDAILKTEQGKQMDIERMTAREALWDPWLDLRTVPDERSGLPSRTRSTFDLLPNIKLNIRTKITFERAVEAVRLFNAKRV
ncbi:hypothetical protein HDU76_001527 [Blyttiomyces sp. JEL0837]|nr:hypothetical protein HDU76_001527 [Blyttiomyces sp. JEL0837]